MVQGTGYSVLFGPDIAPGEPAAERATFGDVVLPKLLSGEVRVKDAADFQRISG